MNIQVFACRHCGERFERPTVRGPHPKWCVACKPKQYREGLSCLGCGKASVRARARYCSRECAAPHMRRGRATSRWSRAVRQLARAEQGTKGSTAWVTGPCVVCAQPFTTKGTAARVCSDRCAKRRRGRLRQGRAKIRRRDIFQRDGYRCQLCRRMTDSTKSVPHPLAPTIDHILPKSLGGTHDPANLQCAHHRCNMLKGNRPWLGAEQLTLAA